MIRETLSELMEAFDLFRVEGEEALPPDLALHRFTRKAMATRFEIFLPFGFPDGLTVAQETLDGIDAVEDFMTVYRDDSEVALLNAQATRQAVPVSPALWQVLALSRRIHQETLGAFDPATGAMTKAWGFYRRSGCVPEADERIRAMQASGFRHVILDDHEHTVRFRKDGLELNFGAIGKGYAVDLAARTLRERFGALSALVHGGSSSVYVNGYPAGNPRGWPISVKHPWEPDRILGTIWLRDCGLGTSAATYQFFEHKGKKLGHVLDPRSGWPASGTALAMCVAPTAAEADALSTAFFVAGESLAQSYCHTHPEVAAILLNENEGNLKTWNFPLANATLTITQ